MKIVKIEMASTMRTLLVGVQQEMASKECFRCIKIQKVDAVVRDVCGLDPTGY